LIETRQEALAALDRAWPKICDECLQVRGGERHYQAMIYHGLRTAGGVPVAQIGLNVRQFILNVRSEHFRELAALRHSFHRALDTDVVIFNANVGGDWRRRASDRSLRNMLVAIDVIASEDHDGSSSHRKRLRADDAVAVIRKLSAQRQEVQLRFAQRELWSNRIEDRGKPPPPFIRVDPSDPNAFSETMTVTSDFQPVVIVVDSAADAGERMTEDALSAAKQEATAQGVQWRYVSPMGSEVI
jgi:hypothetical protein